MKTQNEVTNKKKKSLKILKISVVLCFVFVFIIYFNCK